MIKFKDVSIQYHSSFHSLIDCNISLEKSAIIIGDELFTSAMCRSLMNLDKFDGEILIDGTSIKDIKIKNYPIAYVPKIDTFFENKTAIYNILFPLKIRKFSKFDVKNAENELKNTYNLNFLDKKVKLLSPAERKLTALLRAIIHEPKYILVENIFDIDLNKYQPIIIDIISKAKQAIITTENDLDMFSDFDRIRI